MSEGDANDAIATVKQENGFPFEFLPGAYYGQCFAVIFDTLLKNFSCLFSSEESKKLYGFSLLTESAQNLYARLFLRREGWFCRKQWVYNNILDVEEACSELLNNAWLQRASFDSIEIPELLRLCTTEQLRELANDILSRVSSSLFDSSAASIRQKLIFCKNEKKETFILQLSTVPGNLLAPQLQNVLGTCIKLYTTDKIFVRRLHDLFFLNTCAEERSFETLILKYVQKVSYPKYVLDLQRVLFDSRDIWEEFCKSLELERQIDTFVESSKEDLSLKSQLIEFFQKAYHSWTERLALNYDGTWRLQFTAGYVYTRCIEKYIDYLEKSASRSSSQADDYRKICELLLRLLEKSQPFRQHKRTYWYDRVILHVEKKLKDVSRAYQICAVAVKECFPNGTLLDSLTLSAYHLSIGTRFLKLLRRQKIFIHSSLNQVMENVHGFERFSYPTVLKIYGKPISTKRQRLSYEVDIGTEITALTVEEYALNYYKNREFFDYGLHCEGEIWKMIYVILFWDIIFADIRCSVFQMPYQTQPLDFLTDDFYLNRRSMIEHRLVELEAWDDNFLLETLRNTYQRHAKTEAIACHWQHYSNELLCSLVSAMPRLTLSRICRCLAENYRRYKSGMPDLVLWKSQQQIEKTEVISAKTNNVFFKMVEVKSENDRVSEKQRLWMYFLLSVGTPLEICNVYDTKTQNISNEK